MELNLVLPNGFEKNLFTDKIYDDEEKYINASKEAILNEMKEKDELLVKIDRIGEKNFKVERTELAKNLSELVNIIYWSSDVNRDAIFILKHKDVSIRVKYELILKNNTNPGGLHFELKYANSLTKNYLISCGCKNTPELTSRERVLRYDSFSKIWK